MAVLEDVRPLGAELERSYQVYVRGRLKFRVKQMVYVAFSIDESVMGFAFPKEERAAAVASEPHKFQMLSTSEMRFNWVHADLAALDRTGARELVVDAWRMVVPRRRLGSRLRRRVRTALHVGSGDAHPAPRLVAGLEPSPCTRTPLLVPPTDRAPASAP